ncbi:MAG: hypothetical protein VKK04_15625 [Synechococcales bacterium]|nr:hypothetical protein [Synechococcales bacterium]
MPPLHWTTILQTLPLVLAGPLLRHVTPDAVTVWVALKQPCDVDLTVYETDQGGEQIGQAIFHGQRQTIALGQHLHIAAVTARSTQGSSLESDRLYAYDLRFKASDTGLFLPAEAEAVAEFSPTISYFAHQKPTFALPPSRLEHLRLVHGSCRKAHGDGQDAMVIIDQLIAAQARSPQHRPHQLFLTGDQIYADDIARPLLWLASGLGDALLGWEEPLPIGSQNAIQYRPPQDLPPGQRADVATYEAGFTGGLRHKREKVTSHAFSLGEYCSLYLLMWSPVCWQIPLPQGEEMGGDRDTCRQWDEEVQTLRQLAHTLWQVRRALANVPTYTIFDDHEVSDDWNLNQAWCLRVLGKPLGRRTVQNALLSYAVFQAWGNTPWQFEPGQSGAQLLTTAAAWSASQGRDAQAAEAIAQYLGMPPTEPETGLPVFVKDQGQDQSQVIWRLQRHVDALNWHYTVHSHHHDVIVLDTRMWRGYPDDGAIAPPMLLCPSAFEQQLTLPLQQSHPQSRLTVVIAPTNVFQLKVIDWYHQWQLRRRQVFTADVGDAWNINMKALASLLLTLFQQRRQVVVLSGDIHYGAAVRLTYQPHDPAQPPSVLVQLTASSFKNEELLTHLIHTRLKSWLLPESVRTWLGWNTPQDMVELPSRPWHRLLPAATTTSRPAAQSESSKAPTDRLPPADWVCTLEWLPRQPAQAPAFALERSPQPGPSRPSWWRSLNPWTARWFQEGKDVVGRNNVAVVSIQTNATEPETIVQDLYWLAPWQPSQLVSSRFTGPLTPQQTPAATHRGQTPSETH